MIKLFDYISVPLIPGITIIMIQLIDDSQALCFKMRTLYSYYPNDYYYDSWVDGINIIFCK